ncbi:hypothetical protein M413DRAFT_12289 [Hebeloma cylindrosporum]|uniref:Uncharacterized protein n=1 Tax=Hebeloma cylindrosporum TaxID=76867 RepID=A0A0C2YEA1_HEBCY|nr:hypothetical protein M413DRAFT_12289 [Hebeloma cylindrosporum h7]
MLWYQQFRTRVSALSLAMWHFIMQGFRNIFHAFKPTTEELPITISGTLACHIYLAARASRMARFSMPQPPSPLSNVPAQDDPSNTPHCSPGNFAEDTSCVLQPQATEDPSPAGHFGLPSFSSYDSPSEYGTTPPSSPNLDPPILVVSAPTEEDFSLDRFQNEREIKLDNKLDSEIEVQELVLRELSFSEALVIPDKEPLALVAYKPMTKSNKNPKFIAPVSVPFERVAPSPQDSPTYTRALRDSLLLSPPPFSSKRKPATDDLAGRRDSEGSQINPATARTPLIFQPIVTTPTQSPPLGRSIALSPSQESVRSTFSTVVGRVRASANPKSAKSSSARREAKRVSRFIQEAYDEADPFSTNGESFYTPSFDHSSDINNVALYMTAENSNDKKRTEPKLRRKSSRLDLRTEEVKMHKMNTTLYDMSIYGVPTPDNSKPRKSKTRTKKNSPSLHSSSFPPVFASVVESNSRPGPGIDLFFISSHVKLTKFCAERADFPSVPLPSVDERIPIGKKLIIANETADPSDIPSESTFVVADDPFTKDVRVSLPVGVPPGDLYNFDVYAPSRSYGRERTKVRSASSRKGAKSEEEELRRLSANVSAYAAEVFHFSLSADPLSSSSEDGFSSTEDVPHLRAILDGMEFSPLLLPSFVHTSARASISSLDLDGYPEPLSCGPSEFDSPEIITPIFAQKYERVPAPSAVIVQFYSEAELSLTDADGYSISVDSDPVSLPKVPASTPHERPNCSLPVTQPGADPSVAMITLDPEKPPYSSLPGTTQCKPPQICPDLEPSSVVAVSGGSGPAENPRASWTNLASVVDYHSQNLGLEYLSKTSTAEVNPPVTTGFSRGESHSSRSRNIKDENIFEPSSRRVGIHGSLPRQRRRSSNLSAGPSDYTSNQTRAIVLERHRASVVFSASYRRSGIRGLRLPQRVALRESNAEVTAPTLSTDSIMDVTLVSTSLDDAKEPSLGEADENRNSLDALIALIESDIKASFNSGNLSTRSFQKSSSSQYSIQWGVAF